MIVVVLAQESVQIIVEMEIRVRNAVLLVLVVAVLLALVVVVIVVAVVVLVVVEALAQVIVRDIATAIARSIAALTAQLHVKMDVGNTVRQLASQQLGFSKHEDKTQP